MGRAHWCEWFGTQRHGAEKSKIVVKCRGGPQAHSPSPHLVRQTSGGEVGDGVPHTSAVFSRARQWCVRGFVTGTHRGNVGKRGFPETLEQLGLLLHGVRHPVLAWSSTRPDLLSHISLASNRPPSTTTRAAPRLSAKGSLPVAARATRTISPQSCSQVNLATLPEPVWVKSQFSCEYS